MATEAQFNARILADFGLTYQIYKEKLASQASLTA